MKRTLVIVLVVYVVLLGHFLVSNFVRVIGPNYLIKSAEYVLDYDKACMPMGTFKGCVYECPEHTPARPDFNFKGFPFATNQGVNVCNERILPFPARDFNTARILNAAYLVLVTLICFAILRQTSSLPAKHKPTEE